MLDWVLISNLGTALGTTVLAVATFISTRSANRSARLAERALLNGLRPILLPSNWSDAPQKVRFMDGKWMAVRGGHASLEISGNTVYLLMSVRNAGAGVAVLHGWHLPPDPRAPLAPVEEFHRLVRDIYVPANDAGFCQVAIRDPESAASATPLRERPQTASLSMSSTETPRARSASCPVFITPGPPGAGHDDGWLLMVSRHWNLDLPAPRE